MNATQNSHDMFMCTYWCISKFDFTPTVDLLEQVTVWKWLGSKRGFPIITFHFLVSPYQKMPCDVSIASFHTLQMKGITVFIWTFFSTRKYFSQSCKVEDNMPKSWSNIPTLRWRASPTNRLLQEEELALHPKMNMEMRDSPEFGSRSWHKCRNGRDKC